MSTQSPIQGLNLTVIPGDIVTIGNDIQIHAENSGVGHVRLIIKAPPSIHIESSARGKRYQTKGDRARE